MKKPLFWWNSFEKCKQAKHETNDIVEVRGLALKKKKSIVSLSSFTFFLAAVLRGVLESPSLQETVIITDSDGLRYLNCWEKKKQHQHKILYPTKLSFKSKGGIETNRPTENWRNVLSVDLSCKKC